MYVPHVLYPFSGAFLYVTLSLKNTFPLLVHLWTLFWEAPCDIQTHPPYPTPHPSAAESIIPTARPAQAFDQILVTVGVQVPLVTS